MGYRRLGVTSSHRRAMFRSMVTSLLQEERITTTETRASEIKQLTEKMITLGKGRSACPQTGSIVLNR